MFKIEEGLHAATWALDSTDLEVLIFWSREKRSKFMRDLY